MTTTALTEAQVFGEAPVPSGTGVTPAQATPTSADWLQGIQVVMITTDDRLRTYVKNLRSKLDLYTRATPAHIAFDVETCALAGMRQEYNDLIHLAQTAQQAFESFPPPKAIVDPETKKEREEAKETANALRSQVTDMAKIVQKAGLHPFVGQVRLYQLYLPATNKVIVIDRWAVSPDALRELADVLADERIVLIGHNIQFDFMMIGQPAEWNVPIFPARAPHCTLLQAQTLVSHTHISKTLAARCEAVLGRKLPKDLQMSDWSNPALTVKQIEYAAADVVATYLLWEAQSKLIAARSPGGDGQLLPIENARRIYDLMRGSIPAVVEIVHAGVGFDAERHKPLAANLEIANDEGRKLVLEALEKHSDPGLPENLKVENPGSPVQIARWMRHHLGISPGNPLASWPTTDTGQLATGKDELLANLDQMDPRFQPVLKALADWSGAKKDFQDYGHAYRRWINPVTGRIHANYKLGGTECVSGDSYVLTSSGFQRMDRLATTEYVKSVHTGIALAPIARRVKYENREGKHITLEYGFDLKGSLNHPVATANRGFVALENLTKTDTVLIYAGAGTVSGAPTLPRHNIQNTPTMLTTELAEWTGMFVADGNVFAHQIVITNECGRTRARFLELTRGLFPTATTAHHHTENRSSTAYVGGKTPADWAKKMGLTNGATNKVVPDWIMSATPSIQRSFLRGLSLDSHVCARGRLTFGTQSDEMRRQVQLLLLRQGIVASRTASRLKLSRAETAKYLAMVGFTQDAKAVAVAKLLNTQRSQPKHMLPMSGFIPLRVADIQDWRGDVYDVTVAEPHPPQYVCNGMLVHNTGRFSVTEPALQTINRESDFRDLFIPTKTGVIPHWMDATALSRLLAMCPDLSPDNIEWSIVSVDLGQIQVRIVATLAQDTVLLHAIDNGLDVHALTALACFRSRPDVQAVVAQHWPGNLSAASRNDLLTIIALKGVLKEFKDGCLKKLRQIAKSAMFGLLFGQGPGGLRYLLVTQGRIQISLEECRLVHAGLLDLYSGMSGWMTETRDEASQTHCVWSPQGRVYSVKRPDTIDPQTGMIKAGDSYWYTKSINTPAQAGEAEILHRILNEFPRAWGELRGICKLIHVMHDEMVAEAPTVLADRVTQLLTKIMCDCTIKLFPNIPKHKLAEGGYGPSWGAAK